MNQTEARAAWVAALRSGEYEQGTGRLRREDRYCCLGVACDLYRKHEGGLGWCQAPRGRYVFDGRSGSLPAAVQGWLGLSTPEGSYDEFNSLIALNDFGSVDFSNIADVIEREPEGLFTTKGVQ